MAYMFTLHRHSDMNLNGTILNRKACRGIILSHGKLLMIKSEKYGEVKFPGGGISENEKYFQALKRELLEETGYLIKSKIRLLGSTLEYAKDFEGLFDIFRQESKYYFCDIHEYQSPLHLDGYELEYGYQPLFISIDDAIKINESIPSDDQIPWKERDTMVLKILREHYHEN